MKKFEWKEISNVRVFVITLYFKCTQICYDSMLDQNNLKLKMESSE